MGNGYVEGNRQSLQALQKMGLMSAAPVEQQLTPQEQEDYSDITNIDPAQATPEAVFHVLYGTTKPSRHQRGLDP